MTKILNHLIKIFKWRFKKLMLFPWLARNWNWSVLFCCQSLYMVYRDYHWLFRPFLETFDENSLRFHFVICSKCCDHMFFLKYIIRCLISTLFTEKETIFSLFSEISTIHLSKTTALSSIYLNAIKLIRNQNLETIIRFTNKM